MKVKVLRYATDRDDRIVSAYEEVTFENEYVGWYVDCPAEEGNRGWDNLAVVERIGDVCFVACLVNRKALNADLIRSISDEAQHLQAAMQRRMAAGQWIPLPYIAAYEALGWDSRPLKCHRKAIRADRERKERELRRKIAAAMEARRQQEEQRLRDALQESEKRLVAGEAIEAEMFIQLCRREKIALHPRTLHQLRDNVDWLSKTKVAFKSYNKGNHIPQGKGCFVAIRLLLEKLTHHPVS